MRSAFGKILMLIVLLVLAVFLGGFLGKLCLSLSALEWLGKSLEFGINTENPLLLNLQIIDFCFGFMLKINILQAALIIVALVVSEKLGGK